MEAFQCYFQKLLRSEILSLEDRIEKKIMQLRDDMDQKVKEFQYRPIKVDSLSANGSDMKLVQKGVEKKEKKDNAADAESSVLIDKKSTLRNSLSRGTKQVHQKKEENISKRNGVLMEDREVEWAHQIESRMTSLQVAVEKTINCLLANVEALITLLSSQRCMEPVVSLNTTSPINSPSITKSSSGLNPENHYSTSLTKKETDLSTPLSGASTHTFPSLDTNSTSFQSSVVQKYINSAHLNFHSTSCVSSNPIVSSDARVITTSTSDILPFLKAVDATTKSSFTSYTPTASSTAHSLTKSPNQDHICHSVTSSIVSSTPSKTNSSSALSRKWWQRWNFSNTASPTSSSPTSPLKTMSDSVVPDASPPASESTRSIFYTITPSPSTGISSTTTTPTPPITSTTPINLTEPLNSKPRTKNSLANISSTSDSSVVSNASNLVSSSAVSVSRSPVPITSPKIPSSPSSSDSYIFVTSSSRWPSAFRDLETALHVSARLGNSGEVRRLLAAGVNVSATSRSQVTALHWAAQEGHVEVASILLDAGANVDSRTSHNSTPLHYASSNGHAAMVSLLLHNGASVRVMNVNGWTPLHCAALHGDEETARILLEAGGDAQEKNAAGISPLNIKPIKGIPNVFARLLSPSSDL